MHWSKISSLIYLRLRLLLRQKLGWISIAVGCALVFLALLVARVSFVNPMKIFWDFSLGIMFVLQMGLAVFLGSQLYHEERGRRTLHLILSSGVSRLNWVVGNTLGIWFGLLIMNALWFALTLATSAVVFDTSSALIAFQATLLMSIETLVVIAMSLFFSLFVRPLLGLGCSAMLVIFLHSLSSIQRIFTDPQVGRFIDSYGVNVVLWAGRLLPPLEWLDLKLFVGYEPQVAWSLVAQMTGLGLLWAAVLLGASWLRFDRMDL